MIVIIVKIEVKCKFFVGKTNIKCTVASRHPLVCYLSVLIVLRSSAGRYDISRHVHDVEKYKIRLGPNNKSFHYGFSHCLDILCFCKAAVFL